MKKPHTKARGILFAAAGMFLIPGSVSEVSAAERKDEQPFIQASGIESVLEKCYETEVKIILISILYQQKRVSI